MPSNLLWSAGGDLVDTSPEFGTWFMAGTFVVGFDVAYGFAGSPKEILFRHWLRMVVAFNRWIWVLALDLRGCAVLCCFL